MNLTCLYCLFNESSMKIRSKVQRRGIYLDGVAIANASKWKRMLDRWLAELSQMIILLLLRDPGSDVVGFDAVGPRPPGRHLAEVQPRAHRLVQALRIHRFRSPAQTHQSIELLKMEKRL